MSLAFCGAPSWLPGRDVSVVLMYLPFQVQKKQTVISAVIGREGDRGRLGRGKERCSVTIASWNITSTSLAQSSGLLCFIMVAAAWRTSIGLVEGCRPSSSARCFFTVARVPACLPVHIYNLSTARGTRSNARTKHQRVYQFHFWRSARPFGGFAGPRLTLSVFLPCWQ